MLRNGYTTVVKHSSFQRRQTTREISMYWSCYAKESFNANRQGKLMNKLFGQRVPGSKKHWFPTNECTGPTKHAGNLLFKASQLGKPGGAGKNSSRRSAVLNKLFMEQISSLLATGSIADNFLGRGLQLTRVKIAPDFAFLNVYWMGIGEPIADEKLDEDLQHYSGLLRHELSQLRVMGEVPRIHFVQDKTFANVEHVGALLRSIDLSQNDNGSQEGQIEFQSGAAAYVKHEFYGNKQELENPVEQHEMRLPPMRHDVFSLDHHGIKSKMLTKMRKTKQAWESHNERQESILSKSGSANENLKESSLLQDVKQRITEESTSSSESFKKFLSQRRDRKNTPERKKYRKEDDLSLIDIHCDNSDILTSKQQRDILNQDDYLLEDHSNN